MEYEALPTSADLTQLSDLLGYKVSFERRIKGGQSATTDVLVDPEGQRTVLRRHGRWSVGFDDGIAEREQAVSAAVRAEGVPTPRVLWAGRFGASTALVTDYVVGVAVLQPADGLPWAAKLARTLARIHSVTVTPGLAATLDQAPPSPVDLEMPPALLAHPHGLRMLELRAALSPSPNQVLVHGDYWPGNVLWNDGEIASVLDWEAAVLDDPISDLAYCYAEMRYFGLDEAAEYLLAVYRTATDSDLLSLRYWLVTALCRAVPEFGTYIDGWSGFGYKPEPAVAQQRLNGLILETLEDD